MKIQNTSTMSTQRLKMIIYGQPGVGKTSLASTLKEPTLIVSSEAGLLSLAGHSIDVIDISVDDDGKEVPRPERVSRLGEVYKFVCEEAQRKKYKWLFLDSLTEISQNLVESLQEVYPDKKDGLNLWGDYNKKMMSLIKTFRDLPYYNVVMTALEKIEKDENARRYMTIDVNGKINNRLPGLFDEVFWMHMIELEDKTSKRQLLTGTHENIAAKDRSGKLAEIEPPNLQSIVDKIRATPKIKNHAPQSSNKGKTK